MSSSRFLSAGCRGVEVRGHGFGSHSAVRLHGCVHHWNNGSFCWKTDRAQHAARPIKLLMSADSLSLNKARNKRHGLYLKLLWCLLFLLFNFIVAMNTRIGFTQTWCKCEQQNCAQWINVYTNTSLYSCVTFIYW